VEAAVCDPAKPESARGREHAAHSRDADPTAGAAATRAGEGRSGLQAAAGEQDSLSPCFRHARGT
jgi:hypothetical protein